MGSRSSTRSFKKVLLWIIIPAIILAALFGYLSKHKNNSRFWFDEGWYQNFTLKNGMEVIVIPNHKIPAVTQMVWYKVGSIEDPKGKSGLAHFLEHLMFKGTPAHPKGDFSKLVEQNGGQENAFTSHDYTAYYQVISKDKLTLMMSLEADRMKNLILSPEEVASERAVILEERKMRYDNQPRALLKEKMEQALFPNHPYGTQAIGWEKEMEGLTREDALEFYKKYYAPNNAILIVAGDVKADEVAKLAKKYYEPLAPSKDLQERIQLPEPGAVTEHEVELVDERVREPEIWQAYIAPSYHGSDGGSDFYAAVLLSKILGEGNLSRFYRNLVVDKKLASMAGTDYDGITFGPGGFEAFAIPASGVSINDVRVAMQEEIKKIAENGIDDAELELAKKSLIAEQTYGHEGLQSMGLLAGQLAIANIDPDFISTLPDSINAISADEIQIVAQKIFKDENKVTGVLHGK